MQRARGPVRRLTLGDSRLAQPMPKPSCADEAFVEQPAVMALLGLVESPACLGVVSRPAGGKLEPRDLHPAQVALGQAHTAADLDRQNVRRPVSPTAVISSRPYAHCQ